MHGTIELTEEIENEENRVKHTYKFEIYPEDGVALKREFEQGGESYRIFEVPAHVQSALEEMGFEVREQ